MHITFHKRPRRRSGKKGPHTHREHAAFSPLLGLPPLPAGGSSSLETSACQKKPLGTSQRAGVGGPRSEKSCLSALLRSALLPGADPSWRGKGRKHTSHSRNTHTHKPCITHSIKSKKAFLFFGFGFFFLVAGIQRENSHLLLIFSWLPFTLAKSPVTKRKRK